jgi:hypothetical protein
MVTPPRRGRGVGRSARRALRRRWHRAVRRFRESDLAPALLVCALAVAIGVAQYALPVVPLAAVVVPMVFGNLLLGPRRFPATLVFILAVLAAVVISIGAAGHLDGRRVGGVVISFVVGIVFLTSSFRRTTLGVAGSRGESMLVDLRDRIYNQGKMPALPENWYADAVLRSAGGSSFAGDFMVASRTGRLLQVAVVDVSGKGEQAGSRSLLLSGAFGGLLGALPAANFLPAANDYLLRQDWSEGFATAVHVAIDLDTGDFELRSAGHPPGTQLLAGSGRWVVHEAEGPVLGLMRDAKFGVVHGTLNRGDALLLFTDGLVETPSRDMGIGIDKLLGQGEALLRTGFENGAQRLVDRVESYDDDRALLLLHRRR